MNECAPVDGRWFPLLSSDELSGGTHRFAVTSGGGDTDRPTVESCLCAAPAGIDRSVREFDVQRQLELPIDDN
jgi:hypothetical protein